MSLSWLLLNRLLQSLVTLLGVATLVFFVARITGDPMSVYLPVDARPEDFERLRELWGLDQPLIVQYWTFLANASRGEFGPSIVSPGRGALSVVGARLPATLILGVVTLVWVVLIGTIVGVLSATHKNRWPDALGRTVAALGQAVPSFWIGLMLMWIVSVRLGWLPTSGRGGGDWRNLVLPSIALGLYPLAAVIRMVRSSMVDVLGKPYILMADANGLSERLIVWQHALKNAAATPLTYFGIIMGIALTGSIAVETVFGWPGIGRLAIESVRARDFATIQALTVVAALIFLAVNYVVDIMYAILDPRIRGKNST